MTGGPTFSGNYYPQLTRRVTAELDTATADYLLSVESKEYLDYLVSEAEFPPLEWHEAAMTIEPYSAGQQERYRLRIPITPHPRLREYLHFRSPTFTTRWEEPSWDFEGRDTLVLDVEANEAAVHQAIEQVKFYLGGRNREIEEGNKNVREQIRPLWEAKRRQLELRRQSSQAALQRLNIPLYQDPNAKVRPIDIKPRQLRTVLDRPKPRAATPEPALNRDDVLGLVDFIAQYARQFEVAPRSYAKMEEEELRDLLLGMMNANYPGAATGETFSKLGKADITFRVNSGHVLICECKFWEGAQAYNKALDQLFRYVTWRQNYGVLITFCKLRDMSRALAEAQRIVGDAPSYTAGSLAGRAEDARLSSRHTHPQDPAKGVEVFHLFFDLSV